MSPQVILILIIFVLVAAFLGVNSFLYYLANKDLPPKPKKTVSKKRAQVIPVTLRLLALVADLRPQAVPPAHPSPR